MNAGQLHEKMTVRYESVTLDELGGRVVAHTDRYTDIPVNVRVIEGRERDLTRENQNIGELDAKFTTHYLAGLEMTDRIVWNGGYWDIITIMPMRRAGKTTITARWSDNQSDAFAL